MKKFHEGVIDQINKKDVSISEMYSWNSKDREAYILGRYAFDICDDGRRYNVDHDILNMYKDNLSFWEAVKFLIESGETYIRLERINGYDDDFEKFEIHISNFNDYYPEGFRGRIPLCVTRQWLQGFPLW